MDSWIWCCGLGAELLISKGLEQGKEIDADRMAIDIYKEIRIYISHLGISHRSYRRPGTQLARDYSNSRGLR